MQLAILTPGHNWGGDFAAYIMQAMSVVNGTADAFVQDNRFSMEQSSEAVGPVTYPWLFPLMLAPVYALTGLNIFALKLIGVLCYQIFLLILWFGFRHRLETAERLMLVALFAFNPFMLRFANQVLSDIPFLLFSTSALLLIDRTVSKTREVTLRSGVLIGGFIATAMLTRSNGVLLLPVFIAAFMFRRAYIPLVFGVLTTTSLVSLIVSLLPDAQSSYVDHLSKISFRSIVDNLHYYALLMRDFFAPTSSYRWMGSIVYCLTLPFVTIGLVYHWRDNWIFLMYVVMTLGLYVLWPYMQGLRFLFPVIPFYLYFGILGLRCAMKRMSSARQFLHGAIVLLVFLFFTASTLHGVQNHAVEGLVEDGPFSEDASQLFAYIRQHSSPDEVLVFRKPRVMHLMTERHVLMHKNLEDFGMFDLIIIDRKNEGDQLDMQTDLSMPARLGVVLVFENAQFDVYRRSSS